MKVTSFFKKAAKPAAAPAKAAPAKKSLFGKPAPKAAPAKGKAAPKTSTAPKKSGGWLGSDSQSQDLSKW